MPKIDKIFAFIAHEKGKPDDEGIVGVNLAGEYWPLVAGDSARVEILRPIAEKIAQVSGKKLVLAEFKNRVDKEVILP